MVGDDAAHEVGVGVAERGHQLGEGLFVELAHGAEHALLGLVGRAKGRLGDARDLVQPHDAIHCGDRGQAGLRGPGAQGGHSGAAAAEARGQRGTPALCHRQPQRGHCAQARGLKATNSSSTRV